MREWRYSSTILDLRTVSGLLHAWVSLTLGTITRHPWDRSLGGPQSRFGRCEEGKNLALWGIEPGLSNQ
jgi:hypothetical protein